MSFLLIYRSHFSREGERRKRKENVNKWADMISGSVVKRTSFKTLGRERLAFVFLWDGFGHCLLYNVTNIYP